MIDAIDRLRHVAEVLDRLEIEWALGGSMASGIFGEARATNDIDIAVAIGLDDVDRVVAAFEENHYVDADMIRDAVARSSGFNLIHYVTGFEIDIFVSGDSVLDRRQLALRRREPIVEVEDLVVWVAPPEDQVLRKLWWFRQGGEVSDRQWRDVMAMLKQQSERIDRLTLVSVGDEVGIGDLVQRSLDELDDEADVI